jgi:hypothetical protein
MAGKQKEIAKLATEATMRPCTVRLNELKVIPESYCHREEDELGEASLELFLDSLIMEGGVRVPIVFLTDSDNVKILVAGHRRVTGCQMLAKRNQPGFSHDMEIVANEMMGATPIDRLIESLSDNNNREALRPMPRLKAVKMLHDGGAEAKRAARSLSISDQTYSRDLSIVRNSWMLQHVFDRSIAPTVAAKLVEVGEANKRMKELKEDLDEFIAQTKKDLKEAARRYKANTKKDPRPADLEVKNKMPAHLINHWIDCLNNKRRFDNDADWDYQAGIDKGLLKISPITLDLNKASGDMATKILGALNQTVKLLIPYAQERVQIERLRAQDVSQSAPYDFEFLRSLGMTDQAERLESGTVSSFRIPRTARTILPRDSLRSAWRLTWSAPSNSPVRQLRRRRRCWRPTSPGRTPRSRTRRWSPLKRRK